MRLSRTVSLLKMWQSWSFWHKSIFSPDEGDHWLTSSLAVHDTLMMYVVKSKFAGRCDRRSFSCYATQIIITVLTIFSNLHFLADVPSFSPSQLDKNDHWHTLHDNVWNNIWTIDTINIRFASTTTLKSPFLWWWSTHATPVIAFIIRHISLYIVFSLKQ